MTNHHLTRFADRCNVRLIKIIDDIVSSSAKLGYTDGLMERLADKANSFNTVSQKLDAVEEMQGILKDRIAKARGETS